MELVLETGRVKKNAFNDVVSFYKQVATDSTHEAELLSNASAPSNPMARASAELRQSSHTI